MQCIVHLAQLFNHQSVHHRPTQNPSGHDWEYGQQEHDCGRRRQQAPPGYRDHRRAGPHSLLEEGGHGEGLVGSEVFEINVQIKSHQSSRMRARESGQAGTFADLGAGGCLGFTVISSTDLRPALRAALSL